MRYYNISNSSDDNDIHKESMFVNMRNNIELAEIEVYGTVIENTHKLLQKSRLFTIQRSDGSGTEYISKSEMIALIDEAKVC